MVYIYIHIRVLFSPRFSLSLSRCTVSSARILMLTCPLDDRSDGYLRGTTEEKGGISRTTRSFARLLARFFLLASLSLPSQMW